jgi:hypothetical protein
MYKNLKKNHYKTNPIYITQNEIQTVSKFKMCVVECYQKKSALYSEVLENPLILENIFEHLDAKDTLNLLITNATFTKEERFLDTLDIFVEKKKYEYDTEMMNKKFLEFCTHTHSMLDKFHAIQNSDGSIGELVIQMRCIYDYINDNKWALPMHADFKNITEVMLIRHLNSEHFQQHTLFYLGEIFGIFVKAEDDEDGEIAEYIITTEGVKIYLN